MARFIFTVVLVVVASLSYSESKEIGPCSGGPYDRWTSRFGDCERTCENLNGPGCELRSQSSGCHCQGGTVRRADGRCVDSSDCGDVICRARNRRSTKCYGGDSDKWESNVSRCELTCEELLNPPRTLCTDAPFVDGCRCQHGTVRGYNGKCITPKQCANQKKS